MNRCIFSASIAGATNFWASVQFRAWLHARQYSAVSIATMIAKNAQNPNSDRSSFVREPKRTLPFMKPSIAPDLAELKLDRVLRDKEGAAL